MSFDIAEDDALLREEALRAVDVNPGDGACIDEDVLRVGAIRVTVEKAA
jgi:hypothetical protein